MDLVVQGLPATKQRLEEIRITQEKDPICQVIARYCQEGWTGKGRIRGAVKRYYPVSLEISIINDILMRTGELLILQYWKKNIKTELYKLFGILDYPLYFRTLLTSVTHAVFIKCMIEPMISSLFLKLPWKSLVWTCLNGKRSHIVSWGNLGIGVIWVIGHTNTL